MHSFSKNLKRGLAALLSGILLMGAVPFDSYAAELASGVKGLAGGNIVVVLDAGHDDTHKGANYFDVWENKLTLKIAQYAYERLSEYEGINVYMTRETDECPYPLSTSSGRCNASRVEFAASVNADIYVAIHLNASETNPIASGAEVYIPNSSLSPTIAKTGKTVATAILEGLEVLGLDNRGAKTRNSENGTTYEDGSIADYYTIVNNSKLAGFPGIIIEHCFMSTEADYEAYLTTEEGLMALGYADADAIASCLDEIKDGASRGKLPEIFDATYYWEHYEDVRELFGRNDVDEIKNHFETVGKAEGRRGSEEFDVYSYLYRYAGLRRVFGTDLAAYYDHFMLYGRYEGRSATGIEKMMGALTVYDGVDYALVYDFNYFVKNCEGAAKFKYDDAAALEYFVKTAMKEGIQASETFDPLSYYYQYRGLRSAFGKDWPSYYNHYINYGFNENRKAVGTTELQNGVTVYKDVDYKDVYNYNYFLNSAPELKEKYQNDEEGLLAYFVEKGIPGGLRGSEDFDPMSYYRAYPGLRGIFGKNWKSYFEHYMMFGKNEGRVSKDVDKLKGGVHVKDGFDYAPVYDYNFYTEKYPALVAILGDDENAILDHFVLYGINEGRRGSEEFDIKIYKENYPGLVTIFGDDNSSYYKHYVLYGKSEGRNGKSLLTVEEPEVPEIDYEKEYTRIMGDTKVTLAQMMQYYTVNGGATYPEFYADTDAPTLEDFCRIMLEECRMEGVKAEVAFCQTMLETNYLRYTGSVPIEQLNFAGIGATGPDSIGNAFTSVREGIRAQVQHLKAYGSAEPLVNPQVDPRFQYVTREAAIYVEWLGIQENPTHAGWATGINYGFNIMDRVRRILAIEVANE